VRLESCDWEDETWNDQKTEGLACDRKDTGGLESEGVTAHD
jgi:hypothetical protein